MILTSDVDTPDASSAGLTSVSPIARVRSSAGLLGIGAFFVAKVLSGLAIIAASANWLPVNAFADFTQFGLFLAYLTLISSGGVVNGVIRQIAAHDEAGDHKRILHAAALIWAVASVATITSAIVFSGPLSELLSGSKRFTNLIIVLTVCSSAAGLGQLFCAALTGMGRVVLSLSYQAAGLIAGVIVCLIGLHQTDVALATLGFAAGPVVTTFLSFLALRGKLLSSSRWLSVAAEARNQLRFSGAFLLTSSVPPMILFALRYVYRDSFGVAPVAYWLLANRVSDINTQIVGLYLAQIFLPTLTATPLADQQRVVGRGLGLCVGVSLLALATFMLIGDPLMRLVFHDQLARSHSYVAAYLFGDALRAIVSMAMVCSLARNRPHIYVLIEIVAYILLAAIFMIMAFAGVVNAPFIAYPLAFAIAGVIAWTVIIPDLRPVFRMRVD